MDQASKRWGRYIWIGAIVLAIGLLAFYGPAFSAQGAADFMGRYRDYGLPLFFGLHVVRGVVLMPSTPLVVGAALLYPELPLAVWTISLLGLLASSSIIYFFADRLDFGKALGEDRPMYKKMHGMFESRYGYLYFVLWSFFPGAPTDVACMVAGSMRLPFLRFLLALIIGQGILYAIYVYGAGIFMS